MHVDDRLGRRRARRPGSRSGRRRRWRAGSQLDGWSRAPSPFRQSLSRATPAVSASANHIGSSPRRSVGSSTRSAPQSRSSMLATVTSSTWSWARPRRSARRPATTVTVGLDVGSATVGCDEPVPHEGGRLHRCRRAGCSHPGSRRSAVRTRSTVQRETASPSAGQYGKRMRHASRRRPGRSTPRARSATGSTQHKVPAPPK